MTSQKKYQGHIDQIKNSKLNQREEKDPTLVDHVSFGALLVTTLFQITWNSVLLAKRNAERNHDNSPLCADDGSTDTFVCNRYPNDMGVLYNDLATGVPLAPSGKLFMPMWIALYACMVIHAVLHFHFGGFQFCLKKSKRVAKYEMYNWTVHSLLILYQLTLLFWPMVFAHRNLWLAAGMVMFAGCIIRSVSVSSSKPEKTNGDRTAQWWHYVCADLLNVQTTWLALAGLVALTLALKDNISTITLGDDWAALWVAFFAAFACGLAFYTTTTLGLWAAGGALFAILFRSLETFPGLGFRDYGTNQLTDSFCVASLCAVGVTFFIVLYKRYEESWKNICQGFNGIPN